MRNQCLPHGLVANISFFWHVLILHCSFSYCLQKKSRDIAQKRHDTVMKLLVRRYVTAEQRKRDEYGVTEDDVMEIRQDISAMRYEMIDIYRENGMKTPNVNKQDSKFSFLVCKLGSLVNGIFFSRWQERSCDGTSHS